MRARTLVRAGLLACAMALSGCSVDPPVGSVTASPTDWRSQLPTTGRSLASAGFENEIADRIWLPDGTRLTYRADQPNLVIASGEADQADEVQNYLEETLPGLGWQITGRGDGGLTFVMGDWRGGYARGDQSWALTARND